LANPGARPGLYQADPMLDPLGFSIGQIAMPDTWKQDNDALLLEGIA